MSQPKLPRTFKFVGGPSRKRRRCAPSTTRHAESTSPQPMSVVKAAAATNDMRRLMQLVSTVHTESHASSSPEGNDGCAAPSAAFQNEDVTTTRTPIATSFTDEPQIMPTTVVHPPTDILESLLDWPASTGLTMATDALGPALDFNDPLPLFGAPFHLTTSPTLGHTSMAAPEHSLDRSQEHLPGDQGHPIIEDISSEDSPNSTGGILRDIDPKLDDHSSIPVNISDNFYRLFAQYDREFCVWPLTHDFEANPFRYDIETGRGSPLLWHSILALSYKHIHRETGSCLAEAKVHKRKAVQLLEELDGYLGSAHSGTNLLNGLLILMTLDCATSAQGPWVAHLRRAQRIIEALGAFKIQRSPRIQAQVDMFVWWDVTLGLTTRQGFVLSGPTISNVFNPNNAPTFYNISGCPEELFRYMFRLGTYAREFELASHMTCVTFDMGPVLAVEKAIEEWRAPQYDDPDVEFTQPGAAGIPDDGALDPVQAAHYAQDLYHCAQAWRFALLVYIERVFKWRRCEASMARIRLFARKALNNVLSCRRSVMIQKQLLLPVFLAACETDDEYLREEARDYCNWWGVKTRYDMFLTTLGLLEEVWAAAADPDSWWGSLIDQKSGISSTRQYLFG
ncbi:hypothetical protein NA57DRAFT_78980 [Rhizodiscina lignyota]|uniref:Transcription factor domain-containing protein n=1 Tax=Rhizodiscina lignyota TaxID=1504668 RepID=A0A9P4ICV8_9PEZI|nr:hypothetical protein NA57DRAFT_78980 [Rhizodiscina lignyota]